MVKPSVPVTQDFHFALRNKRISGLILYSKTFFPFLSRWDSMTARNDAATTSENTVGDDDDETDSGGGHRPEEEVSLESTNGGDDILPVVNGSQSQSVHFQKIAFPTPSPTILEEEELEEARLLNLRLHI